MDFFTDKYHILQYDMVHSCGICGCGGTARGRNHMYRGLAVTYTWIFDCVEGGSPDPFVVQLNCILS